MPNSLAQWKFRHATLPKDCGILGVFHLKVPFAFAQKLLCVSLGQFKTGESLELNFQIASWFFLQEAQNGVWFGTILNILFAIFT